MAVSIFHCEYCDREFTSQAALAGHIRQKHPGKGAKKSDSGFNPALHNIIQGYGHRCDNGRIGKVYDSETETPEGVIFRRRCVECNKILKEWFEKWSPGSEERFQLLKTKGYTGYNAQELFGRARATIGRRL